MLHGVMLVLLLCVDLAKIHFLSFLIWLLRSFKFLRGSILEYPLIESNRGTLRVWRKVAVIMG